MLASLACLAGLAAGACPSLLGTARPQAGGYCRPADDGAANLVGELKQMVASTDAETRANRDTLYHVPVVPVSDIVLVADDRICKRAAEAYGPPPGSTATPSVYVVKLGRSGYAVLDPAQFLGEFRTVAIFDTKWVAVGGWTGP